MQCRAGKGENGALWEKLMSCKVVRSEVMGLKARLQIVWENILQTAYSTFLLGVLPLYMFYLSCLVNMAVNCPGCICGCLVGIVEIL